MEIKRTENNLDMIRLMAALSVIISHSYDLLGLGVHDFLSRMTYGHILFSDLGVWTFFIISGYLIDQSFQRAANFKDYFWRRIIRIYPGLIVVVLLCTFIIGPLVTVVSLSEYFHSKDFLLYPISATLLQMYYVLPGVFTHNPMSFVNGSLWTLPYEFSLYVIIALQFFVRAQTGKIVLLSIVFIASLFIYFLEIPLPPIPLVWLSVEKIAFFAILFLTGTFINKFHLLNYISKVNIILVAVLFIVGLFWLPKAVFGFICLPLFIFRIAFYKPHLFNFVSNYGDFSYGTYIYAFVIQQLLVNYLSLNLYSMLAISFVLSLGMGITSWFLIEKPALNYRNLFGRK